MESSKKISEHALIALKEALTHIYWKKDDLKLFVSQTISNQSFVASVDFSVNKRIVASEIVDRMHKQMDLFKDDLFRLLRTVSHLRRWEDSEI